jgi:hypothetical protein
MTGETYRRAEYEANYRAAHREERRAYKKAYDLENKARRAMNRRNAKIRLIKKVEKVLDD